MADNFLERHYDDYLRRKAEWLRKRKQQPRHTRRNIERPEDEAL